MTASDARPVRSGVLAGHRRRARPVVGMLTKDLLEYAAEQWLGVVDAARDRDCDLVCFCGGALEVPGTAMRSNAIYDLVSGAALDGLIVWTSVLAIDAGAERMAEFGRRFASLPMVSVEQRFGAAPVVLMENREGMRAAVNHLIEVHGRARSWSNVSAWRWRPWRRRTGARNVTGWRASCTTRCRRPCSP
jgi:DNA-binding LacI/PurR family transcriptional regulator